MSLSDLANIGNLISSVAVLASVIYLALQVRQGARNQRSLMDRGRSENVSEWLRFIASPDIAPLVLRGHADDPTLNADERRRYLWCLYPLFLHYEDSFYQFQEGMLGVQQYESIRNQMGDSARYDGIRTAWSQIRDRFPEAFRDFADGFFREPKN
jgi:hypothetical protein